MVYDRRTATYLAGSLRNEEPPVNYNATGSAKHAAAPDAIRRLGVR